MALDIGRFCKLMGLTTSDHDNEALTALRKANGMLMEENLTWELFIKQKIQMRIYNRTAPIPPKPAPSKQTPQQAKEILDMIAICLNNITSSSGRQFIASLNLFFKRKGYLTEKPVDALRSWYININPVVFEESDEEDE